MSWLRRLSRDRSSKAEQDLPIPSRPFSHSVDSPTAGQPYKDTQYSGDFNSQDKLQTYRPSTAGEPGYVNISSPNQRTQPGSAVTNGEAMNRSAFEPAPDPLTKAFNEAIRPYQIRIDELKAELEEKVYQVEKLEDERADMHAWIDKRGLRAGKFISSRPYSNISNANTISPTPDVPPSIARAMNIEDSSAQTLSYQLDRKMTVLNHDLHRLQDSLSTHLPTSTFATTLSALIPPVEDLAALPGGPPLAYELIIKLGGNLNSHGGDEGWNNEADAASRAEFYTRLDDCMLDIVRARLDTEGVGKVGGGVKGEWNVSDQVKRLEKTGAFLRSKLGLQQYFPRSLDMLRRAEARGGGGNGLVN